MDIKCKALPEFTLGMSDVVLQQVTSDVTHTDITVPGSVVIGSSCGFKRYLKCHVRPFEIADNIQMQDIWYCSRDMKRLESLNNC